MKFKKGVNLLGVKPETIAGMQVVDSVYWRKYKTDLVITSVTDSKHNAINSDHYKGYAFDCRVWNLPRGADYNKLAELLKKALGKDFVVINESDHIHVGYKPIYIGR